MSYSGSIWRNPSDLSCWKPCQSCFRCEDKGSKPQCNRCSGRHDPALKRDPHDIDDRCRCKEGILQLRTKEGRFIQVQFLKDPFAGRAEMAAAPGSTTDERDWEAYLEDEREKRNDPDWNPIQVTGQ